jgi:hypothetical protein
VDAHQAAEQDRVTLGFHLPVMYARELDLVVSGKTTLASGVSGAMGDHAGWGYIKVGL